MRYKYILIDFDGTILDSKRLERYALRSTFAEFSLPLSEKMIDAYHHLNAKYWSLYESDQISKEALRKGRFSDLFNIFGISEADPVDINHIFIKYSCKFTPMYKGTEEALLKLSSISKLYMVTNGFTGTQKKKIKTAGIGHYFEKIFIAEEVGAKKPERKYFERVHDAIGCPKREEIIIVGDSLMADIKGGADFGIDTCWFNPNGIINDTAIIPTAEIDSLDKVLLL